MTAFFGTIGSTGATEAANSAARASACKADILQLQKTRYESPYDLQLSILVWLDIEHADGVREWLDLKRCSSLGTESDD